LLELKVPPPLAVLLLGASMWGAARWLPAAGFELPGRSYVALGLAAAGLVLALVATLEFRRARTTINPLNPSAASALVVSGVYRYSRNPIYLGDMLILLGWAVFLANAVALLLAPLFVLYIDRFQIVPEERALERLFGDAYADYKVKVRRWL
jgi:protein-S-isoprenylcysteine O-methyltransferase Ste14